MLRKNFRKSRINPGSRDYITKVENKILKVKGQFSNAENKFSIE